MSKYLANCRFLWYAETQEKTLFFSALPILTVGGYCSPSFKEKEVSFVFTEGGVYDVFEASASFISHFIIRMYVHYICKMTATVCKLNGHFT